MNMKVSKDVIKKILKRVEEGSTLKIELPKHKLNSSQWYRIVREAGLSTSVARGHRARVYTIEKVNIVKARVKKGEFINKICKDLGMDYKNFCRFCRKEGVKVMTATQLKANYKSRDYSRSGRKGAKKAVAKKAAPQKATPKKAVKKSSKKK